MKLDYNTAIIPKQSVFRVDKRNAYHLAGRIVAIHLGNAQKNLPPVHFQVFIKPKELKSRYQKSLACISPDHWATLDGGRLIPDLPHSFQTATQRLTDAEKQQCRCAFEADVVTLLAGSLAEAKYVAQRDGEVFNANLIYIGALKFYGGTMNLLTVENYMNCLFPDNKTERKQKLAELFLAAYGFINNPGHWKSINLLAESLHRCTQPVVTCEELIVMFDQARLINIGESSQAFVKHHLDMVAS